MKELRLLLDNKYESKRKSPLNMRRGCCLSLSLLPFDDVETFGSSTRIGKPGSPDLNLIFALIFRDLCQ